MPEGDRPHHDPRHAQDPGRITAQVIELLEPELNAEGFDLLDVRVFQGGGRFQVRVFVDTIEGGIDLGQCTKASRSVGMLLEEADLFTGQYVIEVSSPGVRRPLRKPEHFRAAAGQRVDLKLRTKGGPGRVRGILQEVSGSQLVVVRDSETEGTEETETVRVNLGDVREASLDPEFDAQALINADRRRKREEKRNERREKAGAKRRKSRPRSKKEDSSSTSGDSPDEDR